MTVLNVFSRDIFAGWIVSGRSTPEICGFVACFVKSYRTEIGLSVLTYQLKKTCVSLYITGDGYILCCPSNSDSVMVILFTFIYSFFFIDSEYFDRRVLIFNIPYKWKDTCIHVMRTTVWTPWFCYFTMWLPSSLSDVFCQLVNPFVIAAWSEYRVSKKLKEVNVRKNS